MVTIKTVNHCIKPSVYKHTPIYVCTYICYIQIESRKRKHINYRCSCMYAYSKYMCLYKCKCACLTCAYKHVLNFFSNYTSSLTGRFHRCTCIQIIFLYCVCVCVCTGTKPFTFTQYIFRQSVVYFAALLTTYTWHARIRLGITKPSLLWQVSKRMHTCKQNGLKYICMYAYLCIYIHTYMCTSINFSVFVCIYVALVQPSSLASSSAAATAHRLPLVTHRRFGHHSVCISSPLRILNLSVSQSVLLCCNMSFQCFSL